MLLEACETNSDNASLAVFCLSLNKFHMQLNSWGTGEELLVFCSSTEQGAVGLAGAWHLSCAQRGSHSSVLAPSLCQGPTAGPAQPACHLSIPGRVAKNMRG